MAESSKQPKYKAEELVIVQKASFPVLESNPIDAIGSDYLRLEKLASWFVLRAPLTDVTKLANPGSIDMFASSKGTAQGGRSANRLSFDEGFLVPNGLDCTMFEFVYRRRQVLSNLQELNLMSNSDSVFDDLRERAVIFVGKDDSGKEDSCVSSICRHVRNAFAHGRLAVRQSNGESYIFLEDGSNPHDVDYGNNKLSGQKIEVRARMLLKLSTLEAWHAILYKRAEEGCGSV